MNEEETYKVRIKCSNCRLTGIRQKPKGNMIMPNDGERSFIIDKCSNCGCNTITETPYYD